MDPTTRRNRSRSVEPDVYWRRRLFALAAGLAVLGVLAWAVGGATSTRQAAATTSLNSPAPQPGGSSAGASPTAFAVGSTPRPSASSGSPSASPAPSASSGSPSSSPSASSRHAAAGTHARHATAPARKHSSGSGCPAADVVISLTETSNSYGAAAHPQFGISVVSTDSRTCTLNTGTRYLAVVIRSGGVRVWDSADCPAKAGTSVVTKLARGVPLQRHITWDRLLSSPGCKLARAAARPGTYTVTVSGGGSHSPTLAFVLR